MSDAMRPDYDIRGGVRGKYLSGSLGEPAATPQESLWTPRPPTESRGAHARESTRWMGTDPLSLRLARKAEMAAAVRRMNGLCWLSGAIGLLLGLALWGLGQVLRRP